MKRYEAPELNVFVCEAEDVLTLSTSGEGFGDRVGFDDISVSNS